MLRRFFAKLKDRDMGVKLVVTLGLIGMACILLSSFLPKQPAQTTESPSPEEYRQALEAQLTDILSKMEGVGEVQVLVTLAGSEEYVYAKADDRTVTDTQTRSSVSYVTVGGSREALLETVAHPGITGVVIACGGGGSPAVQERVTRAASVACGLPANRIFVTSLSASKGERP